MPTMPASTSRSNRRAAPPSRVKIATPLPYGLSEISAHRFVVGLDPHHREHRPEDLVAVQRHLRGHAVEQARAEEEAAGRDVGGAPVDDELGAFADPAVDVAAHPVAVRRR